jgi:hypothetical protein
MTISNLVESRLGKAPALLEGHELNLEILISSLFLSYHVKSYKHKGHESDV